MAIINLNFAEISNQAFINVLGSLGTVRDGVVYRIDENGNEIATDTSEEDIKSEMDSVRLTIQYRNERANEYPDVVEQLDMLWHSMDADESKRLEPFYSTIKAIKDSYPKDGSKNSSLEVIEIKPEENNIEVPDTHVIPNLE